MDSGCRSARDVSPLGSRLSATQRGPPAGTSERRAEINHKGANDLATMWWLRKSHLRAPAQDTSVCTLIQPFAPSLLGASVVGA